MHLEIGCKQMLQLTCFLPRSPLVKYHHENSGGMTEKICVRYRICKLRPGLGQGWIKLSIFSASFKRICLILANRFIGQQLSEIWHHEDLWRKWQLVWNKQLSLISGPWHSIESSVSGQICPPITWRVQVGCSFHPYKRTRNRIVFRVHAS